jgi:cell division protease FtsH
MTYQWAVRQAGFLLSLSIIVGIPAATSAQTKPPVAQTGITLQNDKASPHLISLANAGEALPNFIPNWLQRWSIREISFSNALALSNANQITDVLLEETAPPTLYILTASGSAYKFVLPSIADLHVFLKPDTRVSVIPDTNTSQIITTTGQILFELIVCGAILGFWYTQTQNRIKSPGQRIKPDESKTKFDDIAGQEYAKEALREMISLIKDPGTLKEIGSRPPRGLILAGPPGNGKTMLARAMANEAGIPFYNIQCTDILDKFISVGASRVGRIFKIARQNAPCVLFFDEIDIIAATRGSSASDASEERNSILTKLLTEIDGILELGDIILVAATNRFHVLDPAIIRYGRFERHIDIGTPTRESRRKIITLLARSMKIDPSVDMEELERITVGLSASNLTGIFNEAGLLAYKHKRTSITTKDFIAARDQVMIGSLVNERVMSDKERLQTAYHESGHVILSLNVEETDPLERVTILPRGGTLGHVLQVPDRDRKTTTRSRALSTLMLSMGGRAAETVQYGKAVTSGAEGDIDMATAIAMDYVMAYGMSDTIGPVRLIPGKSTPAGIWPPQRLSDDAGDEVRELLRHSLEKAIDIIREHIDELHCLVHRLLDVETLSGEDVKKLLHDVKNGIVKPPSQHEIMNRLLKTSSETNLDLPTA